MKNRITTFLAVVFCCSAILSAAQPAIREKYTWSAETDLANYTVKEINLSTGVRLEYAEQGSDQGIPVIFLHGVTDSWHSFENVLPLLPSNFHAFAISQRGHGNSSRPKAGYSLVDFSNDIAEFIRQKNTGPVIIVGHSMGSLVAQQFAYDHPQLLKAIVLVGADACFIDNPGMLEFVEEIEKLNDPIDRKFMDDFQKATLATPINRDYFEILVNESMKLPAAVVKSVFRGIMEVDFTNKLKTFQAPVLILWGDKDAFCFEQDQAVLQSNIKSAKLKVYNGTGHALHWEQPEKFVDDLEEFVDTIQSELQRKNLLEN